MTEPILRDPALVSAWKKIQAGDRLGFEDGLAMLRTEDLAGLGSLADRVNAERNGDRVLFVLNRQLNPTNICVLSCRFCEFAAKKRSPFAYEMTIEECLAVLTDEMAEVHIVGGLHPDWPWDYYVGLIRAIRERFPRITIKAWTAVEIDYFARKFRKTHRQILEEMVAAGLDTLPGGGAEIFSPRVKAVLFKEKIGYLEWRAIHELAHAMGIRSNATMLYGHIETFEERVDHVLKIREIQDGTGGFYSFIPLAFQPGMTGIRPLVSNAVDDLRTVAMSRLLLDNVPHVKAYWVMLGEETASVALNFGASDLDGTIGEEKIAHAALASSPAGLTRDRIVKLIREAGKIPVERDARYNVLKVWDGTRAAAAARN